MSSLLLTFPHAVSCLCQQTAEESAFKLTSEIDGHALMWLLQHCEDDEMLQDFFSRIPGLHYSKVVDVTRTFSMLLREKMTEALLDFVHHTLTLNQFAQDKKWCLDICKAMMKIAPLHVSWQFFHCLVNVEWDSLLNLVLQQLKPMFLLSWEIK